MSVWKRNELDSEASVAPTAVPSVAGQAPRSRSIANIGPSITIEGDVTGEEDLLIEGRVAGKITVPAHSVTIGDTGHVKAHVRARSVTVEGEVEGDLVGEEDVVVKPSGSVLGNILAPRVSLESGCRFKGSIDMEKMAAPKKKESAPAPRSEPRAEAVDKGPAAEKGPKPAVQQAIGGS